MMVSVLTIGTRGDIQPFLALAAGLKESGYTVRFCSPCNFREFVEGYKIEFFPLCDDIQKLMERRQAKEIVESGNPLKFAAFRIKTVKTFFAEMYNNALDACKDADVIIYKNAIAIGHSVAQKLNIPCIEVGLQPYTPTKDFPSFAFSRNMNRGAFYNKAGHILMEMFLWFSSRKAVNNIRKNVYGLKPLPFFTAMNRQKAFNVPMLYPFSEELISRPSDWDENNYITGYWFLHSNKQWQPPQELIDFLSEGSKPVYIGFGSMTNKSPEDFLKLIVSALELSGQRAVLLSGWGGLGKGVSLPSSIFLIENVPHDWLFPKMAAVIHHGGAGTTASGLRAGIPSIIIPHFADQPFWGYYVKKLGLGPEPISYKKLTAEKLAEAITAAVTDEEMKTRAAKIGELVRAEDGVAKAIGIIDSIVGMNTSENVPV
ncbi:UDP:flavonoid glycosyltransferase YjiC (YdhE family) [Anaerobacterium chartisolvens]|uniref:UDP:flavonoid glycosyltransferase YjiC (YdhE family) n=1 Tax=Anaerobacterium chartisolvens TaxID=1297424 RepID=A0A369AIF9_9FIRM|nr:glycosyltransferase [Anaerobacterium chartisolvens]RCX08076.1 UDP:flavonoid glycosyltransferase YjiC (YdhE family) [Anaerobacterium chartisolvens]